MVTVEERTIHAVGLSQDDIRRRPLTTWNMSQLVNANTARSTPSEENRTMDAPVLIERVQVMGDAATQETAGFKLGGLDFDRLWAPRDPPDQAEFIGVNEEPVDVRPNVILLQGDGLFLQYANTDSLDHYVRTLVYTRELTGAELQPLR